MSLSVPLRKKKSNMSSFPSTNLIDLLPGKSWELAPSKQQASAPFPSCRGDHSGTGYQGPADGVFQ